MSVANSDFISIQPDFVFDAKGVIACFEYNSDFPFRADLVYDGRNQILLNRNNKEYLCLSYIAPLIREKLKHFGKLTIAETVNGKIKYAYEVKIRMVDLIEGEDTFEEQATERLQKLEQTFGKERFVKMQAEAFDALYELENELKKP